MKSFHTAYGSENPILGKYRLKLGILTLFLLFFASNVKAQGPCEQISFSMDDYGPCEFGASYTTQTDCYVELRFILTSGEFASYTVNSADGFMVQEISPSELWVTHEFGFIPTDNHTALFFTLPYDLNTSMSIAFDNACAQLGCEIIGGWPLTPCPGPQDASIIGVKYKECGTLPYINQTPLAGWLIQLLDVDGNLLQEQETGVDGAYTFYDLPKGQYYVRETQKPGWTPKVPASGEYLINLDYSEQRIANFGNCPPQPLPCDCPAGTNPGGNLAQNGNFSGSGGFNTGYTLNNNPTLQAGEYWIGTNPSQINAGFASCGDHTTGSGNMMVVNGAANQSTSVWCQTFTMAPNSSYKFEGWIASLSGASPAQLNINFQINNVIWSQQVFAPTSTCNWEPFCFPWTNGPNPTTVTICLVNQNAAASGNDFALDDISFRKCVAPGGDLSGVVYRECDGLPYTDQPVLSDWTVQLLDTMGNLIAEQVTDSMGKYRFADLPLGWYWVREIAAPGWTPNVPASGQYTVELVAGGSLVRNFGVCPGCSCDSIYMDVVQLPVSSDSCTYALNITNTGAYCFNKISVGLALGSFAEVLPAPGWAVEMIDSQHITLVTPTPGWSNFVFHRWKIGGSTVHEISVSTSYNIGAGEVICSRAFSYQCPPPGSPAPCCPAGSTFGNELVANGDFELGNQGFTNLYTYFPPGGPSPGGYSVQNQSQIFVANNQWACIDHSSFSPTGQMLVIDGFAQSLAWREDVNVVAGTTYAFSAWFNNLKIPTTNWVDPQMALFIGNVNGTQNVQVAGTLTVPENPDQWVRLCGTWTATTTGPVAIFVWMFGIGHPGNDVAIDDISFRACIPPPCDVSISANPSPFCGSGILTANPTGPGPFSYQWSHGQSTQSINVQGLPCGSVCSVSVTCGDGSMSSASYTVTDNIPPSAICNSGVGIDLDANCLFQVNPAFVDGGSTDNCQIQSMNVSPSVITGCGTTTVTLTVTDWCGNTSSCTMGIQTAEGDPPMINCPQSQTVGMDPGLCHYTYVPPNILAADNCDQNPTLDCRWEDPMGTIQPLTGVVQMPKGVSTIRCVAMDDCGNESLPCLYTITVEDQEPPMLNCPPNLSVQGFFNPQGVCQAIVNGIAPTATDNCPIPSLTYQITPSGISGTDDASGNLFEGISTVTYTVTDCGGYVKTCAMTVEVECPSNCTASFFISTLDCGKIAFTGVGNGVPPYTYAWDFGDGTLGSGSNLIHQYTASGTFTVSVSITDANNCTAVFSDNVTISSVPQLNIVGFRNICEGECGTITAVPSSGIGSFMWSSGQNVGQIQICPQTTTTYTVTYIYGNSCTLTSSATVNVIQCDCEDSEVQNGNFTTGLISGDLGNGGNVSLWDPIFTPQVILSDGCNVDGCIQMWGHQTRGEGIEQPVNFKPGCTYQIDFCAKYLPSSAPLLHHQLRFRATNGPGVVTYFNYGALSPSSSVLIGNSSDLTLNWKSYSLVWTAPINPALTHLVVSVWNDALNPSSSTQSWVRVDSICIVELSCPPDIQCGTFNRMGFGYEHGNFIPVDCENTVPVQVQCPSVDQDFHFTGQFACSDTNMGSVPIRWELWKNELFTGISGTAVAASFFQIPLELSYFTSDGIYELRLEGSCGNNLCACRVKFDIESCPEDCSCAELDQHVSDGFYWSTWDKYCRMCFTPVSLKPCDLVEWSIEPLDSSHVNPAGITVGDGHFCQSFVAGGTYTVTMHVKRPQADGSVCETSFSRTIFVNCTPPGDCENQVLSNPGFGEGASFGILGLDGTSDDWIRVTGSPLVKDTSETDNWSMMLLGNDDVYDAVRTDKSYCFEKDTGTISIKAKQWRTSFEPEKPRQAGLMLFVNLVRGDTPITWPCEGDNCYEIACLQFPDGPDDWVTFEFDYDLRDLPVSDDCSSLSAPTVSFRPLIYVGNPLHEAQGGDETYSQVLIDNICVNGRGMVPILEAVDKYSLRIYPNPNPGAFTVEMPEPAQPGTQFRIIDLTGRLVQEQKTEPGSANQTVRASSLPAGLYFLQVVAEGKVLALEKFVKQ